MSQSSGYNFVAGDEDLGLHELFGFANTEWKAADNFPCATNNVLAGSVLGSPLAAPLEDFQSRSVNWLSSPAVGPLDSHDAVDFADLLTLDESTDGLSCVKERHSPSPPPPEVAVPITPPAEITTVAVEAAESPLAVADLASANAEIARLQALLAAGGSDFEAMLAPEGHQSSSSRKRKSTGGEESPSKRQVTTPIGPIEAMWGSSFTENSCKVIQDKLVSPRTVLTSQPHLDFSPHLPTTYISSLEDTKISDEDLQSMQTFLRDNSDLIHGTSHQVNNFVSASNITMAPHPVNMKVKRAPPKHATTPSPKSTTNATSKITKKAKGAPKKTQHKRITSTIPNATTPPATPARHRSIHEILDLPFHSLTTEEKSRILLPLLRGLDPRELEQSLSELPHVQAQGPGAAARIARTISTSPPSKYDTAVTARYPTARTSSSTISVLHASPLPQETVAGVGVKEDIGAVRQREALEKAALLQAQGRKR